MLVLGLLTDTCVGHILSFRLVAYFIRILIQNQYIFTMMHSGINAFAQAVSLSVVGSTTIYQPQSQYRVL
jgi:hypothetical protein